MSIPSIFKLALALTACGLAACAPVMEAYRPDPVDLGQFKPGQPRMGVVGQIGSPISTLPDKGNSCDVYQLYTRGPDALSKGVIAAGEVAADILTWGLAELLFTPAEVATKNAKHSVIFCYAPDGKLLSVNESDAANGS